MSTRRMFNLQMLTGPMFTRTASLAILALSTALMPQQSQADMRCCMAEPKILPDGSFKYTGIPFRLTRPATAIQGFAPFTPSSPRQPDAPTLNHRLPIERKAEA